VVCYTAARARQPDLSASSSETAKLSSPIAEDSEKVTHRRFDMADLKDEGMFDKIRGKLRETWGELTDDDVEKAHGDMEQLVGTIKQRTGETEDSIRERLERMRGEEPSRTS
jgi:uncharacterized protein YjbJ (UPF0337 family)